MKRTAIYLAADTLTLAGLFGMIATGLLLHFVLPEERINVSGQGILLWGRDRIAWGQIHFAFAVALMAAILIHLAMHWEWIWGMVSRWVTRHYPAHEQAPRAARNLAGVVLLGLAVMSSALFVWKAASTVQTLPSNPMAAGAVQPSVEVRAESR